jgi:hypothetical protein
MDVPRSLRSWFVAHGVIAVAASLPLLGAPGLALAHVGWAQVDPAFARLTGAAMLAMGATSLLARDASLEIARVVLRLNLVWSAAAAFALFSGIAAGAPSAAWAGLSFFIALTGVWLNHAIRLRQLDRVSRLDDTPDPDGAAGDDAGTEAGD